MRRRVEAALGSQLRGQMGTAPEDKQVNSGQGKVAQCPQSSLVWSTWKGGYWGQAQVDASGTQEILPHDCQQPQWF